MVQPLLGLALDERLEALGYLGVGHSFEAGVGDGGDRRIDAADRVGAAGGGVFLGRLVQALHGQLDGGVAVHVLGPHHLDGGAGVAAARAGGVEVGFLVAAAGDVVGEDAAGLPAQVVAGEDRHHGQALHGHRQVVADHAAELVGLALQAEGDALHLLVVLEVGLEELHHLEAGPAAPAMATAEWRSAGNTFSMARWAME